MSTSKFDVHGDDSVCEHVWSEPEQVVATPAGSEVWQVTCKLCNESITELLFAEYSDLSVKIGQKTYRALKKWGNIFRCPECGRIIFDLPIIFFINNDAAIPFCQNCVAILGLLIKGFIKPGDR